MLASRQWRGTARNWSAMWLLVIGALVASVMATAAPADAQSAPPTTEQDREPEPEPGGPDVPDEPTLFPTVEPSTGLVDGQIVQVTLTGLVAGANIISVQCAATAFSQDQCDLSYTEFRQADADGVYSVEFSVARQIAVQGEPLDCAPDACIIGVGLLADDQFTPLETGGAAINFDASIPLPPPPTVKVRKNGQLRDGQKVWVRGAGWPTENVQVPVEQCFSVIGERGEGVSESCRYNGEGIITVDGRLKLKTTVHRTHYFGSQRVDCVNDSVTCRIVVRSYTRSVREASTDLVFAAGGELAPEPKLNLQPRKDLVDGQTITVRLRNATLDDHWSIMQCAQLASPESESYPSCRYLNFDRSDTSPDVVVSRALVAGDQVVDCASERNRCFLQAMSYQTQATVKRGLIFASTDEPLPEPTVVFSDNLDSLTDRAVVTAEISGPLNEVVVSQCPADVEDFMQCTSLGFVFPEEEGGTRSEPGVPEPEPAEEEAGEEEAEEEAEEEFGEREEVIPAVATITQAGTLLFEGEVRRVVWLGDESFDCADAPGACVLVAWDYQFGPIGDPAALTFLDEGSPVFPAVEMKNTGLAQRETVTASLTGMSVGDYMAVKQCVSADEYNCRYLAEFEVTEADFSVEVTVTRSLQVGQTIDCGIEPNFCEVQFEQGRSGGTLKVGLTFDPDAPPPPPPIVTVEPRTKLVHGQTVQVTINDAFGYFNVLQCPNEVADVDDAACTYLSWESFEMDEESGSTKIGVRVLRTLSTSDGRIDCAETNRRCKLLIVAEEQQQGTLAGRWIQFDASIPPPPAPSLSASPTTDLVDGQEIQITATTDSQFLNVLQCAGEVTGEYPQRCRDVANINVDELPPTFTAVVARTVVGNDCSRVSCSLVLVDNGTGRVAATQELSFDPDGEKLGAPKLSVTPRSGLADRQSVEVTLTGLVAWHQFSQCVVVDGNTTTNCLYLPSDHEPIRRVVTTANVTLRRVINGHDCASEAGSCALVARFATGNGFEGEGQQKRKLLTFDPNAAPLPGPSITVDPSTGLADGDIVRVAGSGFQPEFELYVGICTADFSASDQEFIGNCANEPSGVAEVGEDGSFEIDIPVLVNPEGFTGESLHCLEHGCVVMATDGFEFVIAEISFDPDAPVGQQLVINGLSWPTSLVEGAEPPTNGFSRVPRFDLDAS